MTMNLKNQKRVAALILKCGETRVWIDPNRLEDASDAITRADIRTLIASGTITAVQKKGVSRGRAKYVKAQKRKGQQAGPGIETRHEERAEALEGEVDAGDPAHQETLKELRDGGKIDTKTYRKYY